MAIALSITATTNAPQTSVIITDYTGISRVGITEIYLDFYNADQPALSISYPLDSTEESSFVDDGLVEILFTKIFGDIYTHIPDGWWTVQLRATSDDYVSNEYGFTIYVDAKFAVFSLVNSVHVPENIKGKAEDLFKLVLFLDGIQYLDTSYINDRGTKAARRLNALNKLLGI